MTESTSRGQMKMEHLSDDQRKLRREVRVRRLVAVLLAIWLFAAILVAGHGPLVIAIFLVGPFLLSYSLLLVVEVRRYRRRTRQ